MKRVLGGLLAVGLLTTGGCSGGCESSTRRPSFLIITGRHAGVIERFGLRDSAVVRSRGMPEPPVSAPPVRRRRRKPGVRHW